MIKTGRQSRILLVTSSFEEVSLMMAAKGREDGIRLPESSHYPMGLAYLHSYLEHRGNHVRLLALNHADYHTCLSVVRTAIEEFAPDIVGLQMLTPNRVSCYRLIEHIHQNHPSIKLVVGGIHASIMYRQLLDKYPFLVVVVGEGELTFAELIDAFRTGSPDIADIDGLAFNRNGSVVVTRARALIEDLDALPFPKHELFFRGGRHTGNIITARGCPFNCSFCSLDSVSRRKVRFRSVKNVVDEIEFMMQQFPEMTTVWIHDDTFFLRNERVIDFCDEIMKRNVKLNFVCSGRAKPIAPEMVEKLVQANFKLVMIGLESGDEDILRAAHKGITPQDAVNAFRLFSNTEIDVHTFLIAGLPGETPQTVRNTVQLMKKLQRIKYTYYPEIAAILTIYPSTEVFEIAKSKGLITEDLWLTDEPTPIFTVENSKEQLLEYKETFMNHLSLDRFWTWAGFRAQFVMVPYILTYQFKKLRKMSLADISYIILRSILPRRLFELLRERIRHFPLNALKRKAQ